MPTPPVSRILVATDHSVTAERAVDWAVDMAVRYEAELVILKVTVPGGGSASEGGQEEATRLKRLPAGLAARTTTRVVVHSDPPRAIVKAAEDEDVDVVVVGNVGMAGRRRFVLGNVPNRVSHSARCTVVIVNTADGEPAARR